MSLTDINQSGGEFDNNLFMYNEFAYAVDIHTAWAFVRHEMGNSDSSEEEAKAIVYEGLQKSGVKIDDSAREYLTT